VNDRATNRAHDAARTSLCFIAVASFGLLASAIVHAAARSQTAELTQVGRSVALDACGACHQVRPGDPMPTPVYDPDQRTMVKAPSFATIMRDPRKDAIYLRAVIRVPHYPMKEQAILAADLDAVVAYLQSLRLRR
jgi:mono/diheme cytochrome c family protein